METKNILEEFDLIINLGLIEEESVEEKEEKP